MQQQKPLRIYSLTRSARLLGVSRQSLYNYLKAGYLTAVKVGRVQKITAAELERFSRCGAN
jgi:excisionase family DNA binding protein